MSRIHDALKKAQQDRAEGPLAGAGAEFPPLPATPGLAETAPPRLGSGTPLSPKELVQLLMECCPERRWKPEPQTLLFDGQNSNVGAEQYRSLRSHLYLMRDQQPLQKLLIASPLPLEGKTFTALNLAQVMVRQQERRALLIDADLRVSMLHRCLGAPSSPGLTDYLSGAADELSVVQRGRFPNLFFIAGGKPVSNASELIGNGRLRLLLDRLAPAFDWIILDSPPVIPVSDAKLLADLCDGVLVVIQSGSTPFDLAQKACQEFREKHLLGVVLNRVAPGHVYTSYYYQQKVGATKQTTVDEDRKQ